MTPQRTEFSRSREARDRFCKAKDKVLLPILRGLSVPDPQSFRAILMPSLYGIEARFLVENGVPPSNIFAIEDNSAENGFDVHDEIVHCRLPDRQEMKGMLTTVKPTRLVGALEEAWFAFDCRPCNLIYLDFLSQPDFRVHYWGCLRKIFKGEMLAKGSTLILNFGKSRCREVTAEFNHDLSREAQRVRRTLSDEENPKVLIEAAVESFGSLALRSPIRNHSYWSSSLRYTTTVANF
jgi:hypothetical protein